MRPARAAVLLVAAVLLGGCAISETHHRPGTSHAVATAAPGYDSEGRPYGATATIRVAAGRVTPPAGDLAVVRGRTVRLAVTSDRADRVEVDGYTVAADLAPGVPASLEFTADRPGRFAAVARTSGLVLTRLVVR